MGVHEAFNISFRNKLLENGHTGLTCTAKALLLRTHGTQCQAAEHMQCTWDLVIVA